MNLDELKRKHANLKEASNITFDNIDILAEESKRVVDVAHNAENIIADLDSEFENLTELNGTDVKFLFLATAIQCCRVYLINNITKIEKAGHGNKNEDALHKMQEKIYNTEIYGKRIFNLDLSEDRQEYYAPLSQIITTKGVPYDTQNFLNKEFNIGMFKGGNHRYSTMGHDLILGLIFGTGNILTNTITTRIKTLRLTTDLISFPFLHTNHVVYTDDFKHPRIEKPALTGLMLSNSAARVVDDPMSVIAAIIKQIIHIGTDLYTPCGIHIPGANLMLSTKHIEILSKYITSGDIIKIGASDLTATFINYIIATIHMLLYDKNDFHSRDIYNVKTRKIIFYSNAIAVSSNVIKTAVKALGTEDTLTTFRELDIGGIIVLCKRLTEDQNYIRQVKQDFVLSSFNSLIEGNKLELRESNIL